MCSLDVMVGLHVDAAGSPDHSGPRRQRPALGCCRSYRASRPTVPLMAPTEARLSRAPSSGVFVTPFRASRSLHLRGRIGRPVPQASATSRHYGWQAPTLALGALQRLAGSTWLLTNAPTTAPSTRLAKKNRCAAGRPASTLPASLALHRYFMPQI